MVLAGFYLVVPGMPVRLPKFVKIENTRLRIFQAFTQVGVILVLSYVFFGMDKQYLEVKVPMGGTINWAESPNNEDLAAAIDRDFAKEYCDNPRAVAFKFSNLWSYEDFKCLVMSNNEMSFKVGKDIIYFPTYFHEEWEEMDLDEGKNSRNCELIKAQASRKCASGHAPSFSKCWYTQKCTKTEKCYQKCGWKKRRHYFTVGVEDQVMAFQNMYKVALSNSEYREGSSKIEAPPFDDDGDPIYDDNVKPSEVEPLLTRIMQMKDGTSFEFDCGRPVKGLCRFDPGTYVQLKIGEWLRAANFDLDDVNTSEKNVWKGKRKGVDVKDHPIFRITGAEIDIMSLYQTADFHSVKHNGKPWPFTVANIIVQGSPTWTGMPINRYDQLTEAGTGGARLRTRFYEGVRFRFTSSLSSQYGVISLAQCISAITSIFVFYGAVQILINVIALYLMGETSKSYMRAAQEPFTMRTNATEALPSKLVSSAGAFYMLYWLGKQKEEGKNFMNECDIVGIDRQTFQLALTHIFNNWKQLDPDELSLMGEHAFRAISDGEEKISLSRFCESVTSTEPFNTEGMVHSYDIDRKRTVCEHIFDDGSSRPKPLEETEPIFETRLGGIIQRQCGTKIIKGSNKEALQRASRRLSGTSDKMKIYQPEDDNQQNSLQLTHVKPEEGYGHPVIRQQTEQEENVKDEIAVPIKSEEEVNEANKKKEDAVSID